MLKSLGVRVKDLWEMKGIFVGQNISTSKHGLFFQIFCSARLLIRQTTAIGDLPHDEVTLIVALTNFLLRMRYIKQDTE